MENKQKEPKQESMHEMLVTHASEGIIYQESSGEIMLFNRFAEKLFGIKSNEVIGKQYESVSWETYREDASLFPGKEHPSMITLRTGKSCKNVVMKIIRSNGTFSWINVNTNPVFEMKNRKATGVVITFSDITEQLKMQSELAASEQMFRLMAEQSSDNITLLDLNLNITYVSQNIEKMRGYTLEEAKRQNLGEIFTPDSYALVLKKFEEHIKIEKTGKADPHRSESLELEEYHKLGHTVWLEVNLSFMRDEKMNPIAIIAISRDITEKKKLLLALNESEEKYRELFELNREGIIIFMLKEGFPVIEVNEAVCKIVGYEKETMMHLNPLLKEKGISEELINQRISIIKEKGFLTVETIIFHKNGQEIPVRIDFQLISYKEESAVQSTIIDITEIKAAEAESQQLELDYTEIFNSTRDAIFIHDAQTGKITDANKATYELYGYNNKEDVIMQTVGKFSSALLPYTDEFAIEIIKKVMNGHPQKFEWHAKKSNGTLFWVEVSLSSTSIGGENRVLAVVRDISERKEAESRIIAAKNEALEKNLLKSAFLANMSHDMRTPLNAILGFSKIIAEDQIEENNKKQYMSIIESSGKQLLTIINDLIDITKIEANQLQIKKEKTCLNEIILELYIQTKIGLKNKNVELQYNLGFEDDLSYIITDNIRLRQILNNLISNATKFTENGMISFGYAKKGNEIEFYVEDTGAGIPQESQKLIFERYKQLDNQMEIKTRGFGLGLAISRSLVELLGGKIWVESETGKGSRFIFTLPYITDEMAEENVIEADQNLSAFNGSVFLVVDDEWVNYMYLRELLLIKGINILYANNGLDAVRQAQSNPDIKLVLMDIRMPVMNGFEAAAEIRKMYPEIPIVFQTAFALTDEKQKIIDKGFDGILFKPIKAADLYNLVFEALKNSKK